MKCVVCHREGGSNHKGVITLQTTTHGSVCPRCIDQLVGSVMRMRNPWSKNDLKAWGYRERWGFYGSEEE